MKLETFFEKFEQFADAPNAVAKMRELVLELAVQGKLVDQRPTEGDGHALLNQIRKKNPLPVTDTEEGFGDTEISDFPNSWAPSKLGEVAEIIRGVTFPGSAKSAMPSKGDVVCLRTASVQAEIDWDDLIFISPTHVSRPEQWVAPDDIMISMANSYALVGKVAIVREVPQKATFGAFLAAIRPVLIEPYFLLYVLRSPRMQAAFRASSSQTTNIANISLGRMRPLPFPLPPLAEQKRIVAKVDELMALCDRLEAQQQERDTRHAALARASLARFAEAPTPDNLDFLFHQSYTIPPADLRKSILTLAVQGKLVPQDPCDESADEFITRIAEYRRVKKAKVYEPVAMEDAPYEVPFSWSWVRLGNISLTSDSGWSPQCLSEARSGADWGVLKVSAVSWGVFKPEENKALPPGMTARPDCEVKAGDFLLSRANTEELVARSVVVDQTPPRLMMSDKIVRFTFPDEIEKTFINLANSSDPARDYYARNASGTSSSMKNIGREVMCNLPIPLPPLAEQRRIVAKVDQLMALVDQLETQLATSRASAEKLMQAVVAELTAQD
jgi:type I restriction enzyme S subunit